MSAETVEQPHEEPPAGSIPAVARRVENAILLAVFFAVVFLPLSETFGRMFGGLRIPNSAAYLRASVLWLTFVGAIIATREHGHIGLSFADVIARGHVKRIVRAIACSMAAAVCAVLASASYDVVHADVGSGEPLFGFVPIWIEELVMPASLALIAALFAWQAGEKIPEKFAAVVTTALAFAFFHDGTTSLCWPLIGVVMIAMLAGAPIFVAMTGIALLLFFKDGTPISAVPAQIFSLLGSPTLPAVPILTGCGYVLAESKASQRLVRLFRAVLGSMRGGVALAILALLAAFTTFTGGSGVTILALGGLGYGILREDGQEEGFSLGLVTTAGSLGLLFPPSIPVILYSVVASVPADLLYIAGALPGLVLFLVVALYAVFKARRVEKSNARPTQPFSVKELGLAFRGAIWEMTVPAVVLVLFFSGLASMVEAAAAAFAWSIVVECAITRDIHPVRDLPRVLRHAGILVGAVLILLSSAYGFSYWLVDAQIPDAIAEFATAHVHSKWLFLLVLNVVLLVLGSVFEIYAAIVVLAPIVAPLGAAFGVNPIHLGVVFLANLELGFLLPPAGLNLFLSASRFKVPLTRLYREIIPFLIIMGIGVLLITYATPLTEGVLTLFGKSATP